MRRWLEQENNQPAEGVASDNFSDAKRTPVNPIAMCLLLTCCNKATASWKETIEAIMKLRTMPQPGTDQIAGNTMSRQRH